MTLDISRIGDLSSVGLLADKVLLQLHYLQTESGERKINLAVFQRASNYLAQAIEGISSVTSLELKDGTAFAVDAYQTVSKAVIPPSDDDIGQTKREVIEVKSLCDSLASIDISVGIESLGEIVGEESITTLYQFFTRLSQYATNERSLILQTATSESLYRKSFRYV